MGVIVGSELEMVGGMTSSDLLSSFVGGCWDSWDLLGL